MVMARRTTSVVLPDPDAALDSPPSGSRTVRPPARPGCRRRAARRALAKLAGGTVPEPVPGVEWFMDYRNGDGSIAEMCGNGVRVCPLPASNVVGSGRGRDWYPRRRARTAIDLR
ncbi:hypothetical protein HBB16_03250 [Pseudonocardia sp. MCCB 268]|nr:hypothetical protein [Pseudonocardia cytotoxica]